MNINKSGGTRRISWIKYLKDWFGMTSKQLFRATASKYLPPTGEAAKRKSRKSQSKSNCKIFYFLF